MFNEPALNTFDQTLAQSRVNETSHRIVDKRIIYTRSLEEILHKYLPAGQVIDFLTIDVEGFELEVLKSNDWKLFKPEYVVVECLKTNLNELLQTDVYRFLLERDYEFLAKTLNTAIFRAKHG